jgi:putative FmdB family regulatory protein
MPIYEYRCGECGYQKEYMQRMSDALLTDCPKCGKRSLTKLMSAAGFQLKGTGWYATDFKNSSKKPAGKPDKADTKQDKADTKQDKTDTKQDKTDTKQDKTDTKQDKAEAKQEAKQDKPAESSGKEASKTEFACATGARPACS